MANKPKIKKRKKRKRGTASKTTTTLLSEKKEEAGNVSEERVKGLIHVIRVSTRYNPIELTATRQAKDAHKQRQNEWFRETSRPPPLTCTM